MARVLNLDTVGEDIRKSLARSFESGHVNFIIGSGASYPAIPIAGSLEAEIAKLFDTGKEDAAYAKLYDFLATIQAPTNNLIDAVAEANNTATVDSYSELLGTVEAILRERRTSLLPKRATVFTTNYDLFIEQASVKHTGLRLNDGFSRVPSLTGRSEYNTRTFFTTTSSTGNLYDYKVDIPSVNLMKLHGSLSWKKDGENILFSVQKKELLPADKTPAQIKAFVDAYAVVLPQTKKFRTTLMESTYYELLRIYSNEMDREGSLLISFGFSFGDDHILGITKRALKNPTLRLIAFAFNDADRDTFIKRFKDDNNVEIIAPGTLTNIGFTKFNEVLRGTLPLFGEKKK